MLADSLSFWEWMDSDAVEKLKSQFKSVSRQSLSDGDNDKLRARANVEQTCSWESEP